METRSDSNQVDQTIPESEQKLEKAEKKYRVQINWFFLIAGFSLVNTILFVLGLSKVFIVGLGISR